MVEIEPTEAQKRHWERSANWHTIEEFFGIRLTWAEKAALGFYEDCFRRSKILGQPHAGALYFFMVDYFGLDELDLGSVDTPIKKYGKVEMVAYGLDLLRTPEFIEYCRRNVEVWRQDRELI